ncbi:MAG: hypothetical protein ACKO7Y_00425 [Candidatus Nitrosotenuis sp.]
MAINKEIMDKLVAQKEKITHLIIQNKSFMAISSEIVFSDVPVSRPTTRGGVYFSDTTAYKAKILVTDFSISQLLSQAMLGPNTEFAKIQLVPESNSVQIIANLTNYVQKSSGIELNLTIMDTLSK